MTLRSAKEVSVVNKDCVQIANCIFDKDRLAQVRLLGALIDDPRQPEVDTVSNSRMAKFGKQLKSPKQGLTQISRTKAEAIRRSNRLSANSWPYGSYPVDKAVSQHDRAPSWNGKPTGSIQLGPHRVIKGHIWPLAVFAELNYVAFPIAGLYQDGLGAAMEFADEFERDRISPNTVTWHLCPQGKELIARQRFNAEPGEHSTGSQAQTQTATVPAIAGNLSGSTNQHGSGTKCSPDFCK
jgi:hypothetical protein